MVGDRQHVAAEFLGLGGNLRDGMGAVGELGMGVQVGLEPRAAAYPGDLSNKARTVAGLGPAASEGQQAGGEDEHITICTSSWLGKAFDSRQVDRPRSAPSIRILLRIEDAAENI